MILGEGGAMMILEPLDAAQARGARIYAEICGFGMTSDAHHLTQPTVIGPARAMRAALREGGIEPEQVGYINAHGTGTPGNDPTETRAIREVFGAHADKLPVSSTKSLHGHALGAAGALEAIATILALHHGILPPTANYNERDPECDLDYIPNQSKAASAEAALSNSFAFQFIGHGETDHDAEPEKGTGDNDSRKSRVVFDVHEEQDDEQHLGYGDR
jgi:nodulation protein E